MKKIFSLALVGLLVGCSSNPVNNQNLSLITPSNGKAGIYIYRGDNNKYQKDTWINGQCASRTTQNSYVYKEVDPGVVTVSTEGQFKNGHIKLNVEPGKLYFFEQTVTVGAGFVVHGITSNIFQRKQNYAIKKINKFTRVNYNCKKNSI